MPTEALEPNIHLIQWAQGNASQAVKRPERETDYSSSCSDEVNKTGLYVYVTLWRVRITIADVQNQNVLHSLGVCVCVCVCVCILALVIQHAKRCAILYCHMWPVRLYHIFPHYLINSTISEKKKSY